MLLIAVLFSFASADQPDIQNDLHTSLAAKDKKYQPTKFNIPDWFQMKLRDSLNAYFQKAIDQKLIVGASVAIVQCDSIIYADGFGMRNTKEQDRVNRKTVFRIGSVSKGFAGILSGIQVEKGLLNWDDKIIDYVPEFRLANKRFTNEITLEKVLSHTTGLPYHSYTNLVEDGLSLEEIAARFSVIKTLNKPGELYNYQNAVFALSGSLIEKSTNKPYTSIIANDIFKPLGMLTASTTYEDFVNNENIALPHRRMYGSWRPLKINKKYYNAIAAGGVNASAEDMGKYMKMLLGYKPDVISPMGLEEVFKPRVQVGGRRNYYQRWPGYVSSHYALGWRHHTFKDEVSGALKNIIHHGGHVNSYRSEIAVYPEEDLGITVLFNTPTTLARTVIPDIRGIIKAIKSQSQKDEYLEESIVTNNKKLNKQTTLL
ncbi:beta-lactamase class C [Aquimarina brevivitae]|uniref:Beta-lactamase class C n=2 Tax=Aquimarina brevivitae TaxID=323412 RepID=A0A4Q7PEV2_9FLAO|nr:beta-lactamase class C [Aquimarina brevivitae]